MKTTHRSVTPRSAALALLFASLLATSSAASALEKLRVGTPAAGFVYAVPLAVAQQQGFFSQLGLDVEVTNYRGGAVAQESLLTGDSDIANIGFGTLAIAVTKGVRQRCVAVANASYTGWMLMVPQNSKITSAAQVNGKRVGITAAGSLSDLLVGWAEQEHKLKTEKIPLGSASSLQAAANGDQIAAFVSWPPNSYEAIRKGTARRLVDYGKDVVPQYTGCWAAMDATAEKRAQALQNFGVAYHRAVEYMKANPDYSIDFLVKFIGGLSRDVAAEVYGDIFRNWTISTEIKPEMVREALTFNKLPTTMSAEQTFNVRFFTIATQK
ncbi:MAG: ABC transporter substrate-binding protein [Lautropia sp.]